MKVIGHDSGLPQGSTGSFLKASLDTVACVMWQIQRSAQGEAKAYMEMGDRILNNWMTLNNL